MNQELNTEKEEIKKEMTHNDRKKKHKQKQKYNTDGKTTIERKEQ